MIETKSKKMMMAGAAVIAVVVLVGIGLVDGNAPSLTKATNTYSASFNSSNRPFSGSVPYSTYKTSVSSYSSYSVSGHDPIRSAAIQGTAAKVGTLYYPSGSVVAATVATDSTTVNSQTVYESVVRFVIGAKNITAFAAQSARSNIYSYNAFYAVFYNESFTSIATRYGSADTEASGGFYTDTITAAYDGSKGVARWVELQYCVTSTSAGSTGVSGAYIESASISWAC
jgi:hypothetical protein